MGPTALSRRTLGEVHRDQRRYAILILWEHEAGHLQGACDTPDTVAAIPPLGLRVPWSRTV